MSRPHFRVPRTILTALYTPLALAAVAGLFALVSFGALVAGCGSSSLLGGQNQGQEEVVTVGTSSTTDQPATTAPVTVPTDGAQGSTLSAAIGGMTFDYPAQWHSLRNGDVGFQVAEREEDVAAPRTVGARLRVEVSSPAAGDTEDTAVYMDLLDKMADEGVVADMTNNASVVIQPQQIQVGGRTATLVGLQDRAGGQSTITDYIMIGLDDSRSILLILEASTDQWQVAQSKLEAILSTVLFQ